MNYDSGKIIGNISENGVCRNLDNKDYCGKDD